MLNRKKSSSGFSTMSSMQRVTTSTYLSFASQNYYWETTLSTEKNIYLMGVSTQSFKQHWDVFVNTHKKQAWAENTSEVKIEVMIGLFEIMKIKKTEYYIE